MQCFYIDLASHEGRLACVTENAVVASKDVDHRIGDHEIVPMMQEVLRDAGWAEADLTHVACVIGPGGFTSLRVAVAFANTLADQLDIPSTGIHLSDLYAARTSNTETFWLHSTKKNEVFARGGSLWPEPTHLPLSDALEKMPNGVPWTGELISEHREAFEKKGLTAATILSIEEVLPSFLQKTHFERKILLPWYGRSW